MIEAKHTQGVNLESRMAKFRATMLVMMKHIEKYHHLPTYQTMGVELGVCQSAVFHRVKHMIKCGYIERIEGGLRLFPEKLGIEE